MREQIIREVFAFLEDHYWDSLEDQRHILEAHFNSCERILIERQAEGGSSQPPGLPPDVQRAFLPGEDPTPLIDYLNK